MFTAPATARQLCGGGGTFIKRVIGLPGETVSDREGFVFVNGRKLGEPYIARWARDRYYSGRVWLVPARKYLLLGDNRAQSCDSREYGAVRRGLILGKGIRVRRGNTTITLGVDQRG